MRSVRRSWRVDAAMSACIGGDPVGSLAGGRRSQGTRSRPGTVNGWRPKDAQPCPQEFEACGGRLDGLFAVVQLVAVAGRERQVTQGEGIDAALGQFGNPFEVAGGLGHLPPRHQQVLAVDPDGGGWPAHQRRRLRDLVLVVREDVVDAAGMDVEPLAEVFEGHRRALEVPAREALAPARRPLERALLAGGLPQCEIGGVALVVLDVARGPVARPEIVERVARQFSVALERRDGVVDVVVVGAVGVTPILEPLGEVEHLGDVLGRAREDVGGEDVDERLVGVERGLVRGCDIGGRLVLQARLHEHPVLPAIELVIAQVTDIGDVLDVEHFDTVIQQHAPDEIRQQVAPQVADMRIAVDGRATRVHAHAARFQRLDRPHLAGQRVAQSEGHRGLLGGVCGVGQRRTTGVHPTRGDQSSNFVAKGP